MMGRFYRSNIEKLNQTLENFLAAPERHLKDHLFPFDGPGGNHELLAWLRVGMIPNWRIYNWDTCGAIGHMDVTGELANIQLILGEENTCWVRAHWPSRQGKYSQRRKLRIYREEIQWLARKPGTGQLLKLITEHNARINRMQAKLTRAVENR